MAVTNKAGISQRTNTYAEAKMLSHAQPELVLQKFGQNKPIPKNTADNAKFRAPVPFAAATTPLTEGVAPTAQAMSYTDKTATLAQYGGLVNITDQVADTIEDPVINDAAMLCGEQAGETLELVLWGVLQGGTNVSYAAGETARIDVDNVITLQAQRNVTRSLKAQKAKKVTSIQSSSVKYGTEAIDAAYICIGHTDCEADIRDMAGFVPVEKYGAAMTALPFEIGKVEDVRYILTATVTSLPDAATAALASANTTVSTSGTLPDVYTMFYFGKEAYGCTVLKGQGSIKPGILAPDQISKSDPLGQNGFVSWKTYFAGIILNETWCHRLEVAVSDLS